MLKDKIRLIYTGNENYLAYSLIGRYSFQNIPTEDFYQINSDIIPATALSIDKVSINDISTDYLIAWFDNAKISQFSHCYIGIADKCLDDAEIEYFEKYHDVDDYIYMKSAEKLDVKKMSDIIREKVITLDKVPLHTISEINDKFYRRVYENGILVPESIQSGKISIPHRIKPISENDWSNIRYSLFPLQRFGGNSIYPFAWLLKTNITKKETFNVITHNKISS